MLQINSISNTEFPKEYVLQCKEHFNQVYRERKMEQSLRSAGTELTLLEMETPKPFELYDAFEIQDFTFSKESQTGHFRIQMSFKKVFHEMGISAQLLNMETEEVLAEIPLHKHSDDSFFVLEDDFTIRERIASKDGGIQLGLIARGEWGDSSITENKLSAFKEANSTEEDYQYNHIWPKVEESVVTLKKKEDKSKLPEVRRSGSRDHIVIAMNRSPKELSDIDYLCDYGVNYPSGGLPILCVPGQGDISFSSNEIPKEDEEHKNYAICKLYKKGKNGGGASVIAGTPDYCLENKIKIQAVGKGYHYEFVSWNTSYEDEDGWKKTEFDYHLEMLLHTVDAEDPQNWHPYPLVISTLDGVSSFTDEIRPLYIMYGCVAPWTKIRMADGNEKEIQNIQMGEFVTGRNGEKLEVCNIWRGGEDSRMLSFTVEEKEDDKLLMTKDHPVLIQTQNGEEQWKMAKDCYVGELVLVLERDMEVWRAIRNISEEEPCEEVWNLEVRVPGRDADKAGGAMFTGGVLTGDYVMQNALEE